MPTEKPKSKMIKKRKIASGKRRVPSPRKTVNKSAISKERQQELRREQIAKTHRRRRKKRKRNYTLYYIILAIFLIIAGVTLSMTVFFNIESIKVEGSAIYTLDDVNNALDAKVGDNLLRLNTKKLSEDVLRTFEKADDVQVKRIFPTTLLVKIEDGIFATQLYSDNKFYILSKRGRVLDVLETSIPNIPIIVGPQADSASNGMYVDFILENEERDWISILFNEIEKSKVKDISAVDISNTLSVKIYYQNRFQINLGSFSELDTKLAMVYEVIASGNIGIEESGIIDITDPDKMYVDSDAELELESLFVDGWEWQDPHYEEVEEEEIAVAEEKISSDDEEIAE